MPECQRLWVLESDQHVHLKLRDLFDDKFIVTSFSSLWNITSHISRIIPSEFPDLLITSLELTDGNFRDFWEKQSELFKKIPFYVLSDNDNLEIMRFFYRNGVLGYFIRPINFNLLMVSVEANMIKISWNNENKNEFNEQFYKLTMNFTPKEQKIFLVMLNSGSEIIDRDDISNKIWSDQRIHKRTFDVHLCNIRAKLIGTDVCIITMDDGKYRIAGFPVKML